MSLILQYIVKSYITILSYNFTKYLDEGANNTVLYWHKVIAWQDHSTKYKFQ